MRWQESQGHSQGVSLGTDQGSEGWRMGPEGQTDSPALATCSQIPFQPERMLQNYFCPSPPGQESYRMGQNLRNSGIPEMFISWCETRRWVWKKQTVLIPRKLAGEKSSQTHWWSSARVQGPGVKQSHTHQVSDRRGLAVLAPSLFLLPYASLINGPSVLIPSFPSALSFPSCGGPQDKVGPPSLETKEKL